MVAAPSCDRLGCSGQEGGHRKRILDPHRAFITERVHQTPHLSLHGLKDELAASGVKVSHDTVWQFLRREGLQLKTLFALEQARTHVARRRQRWRSFQASIDPIRWCSSMRPGSRPTWRRCGDWGPKGECLRGFAPHGHWRTLTFLDALRCCQLTASCVFDGLINGQCSRAYVEQQLLPVLKPGDIVVLGSSPRTGMDNLRSHMSAAIRQMIRAVGARLWFLSACSPDLKPIEQALSKIKHWMRNEQKRTIEETWRPLGNLVSSIQPDECRNYFVNAGYASVKI